MPKDNPGEYQYNEATGLYGSGGMPTYPVVSGTSTQVQHNAGLNTAPGKKGMSGYETRPKKKGMGYGY